MPAPIASYIMPLLPVCPKLLTWLVFNFVTTGFYFCLYSRSAYADGKNHRLAATTIFPTRFPCTTDVFTTIIPKRYRDKAWSLLLGLSPLPARFASHFSPYSFFSLPACVWSYPPTLRSIDRDKYLLFVASTVCQGSVLNLKASWLATTFSLSYIRFNFSCNGFANTV